MLCCFIVGTCLLMDGRDTHCILFRIEDKLKKLNLLDSEKLSDHDLTKRGRIEYAVSNTNI